MAAAAVGGIISSGFLLAGYLTSCSAEDSGTLAKALTSTQRQSLAKVDARLASLAAVSGRNNFDREYLYTLMAGRTWCPPEEETKTLTGQTAVIRKVSMHDEYETYSWKEVELDRTLEGGDHSKEKSGKWITKQESKNHRSNQYGDTLRIEDDSYSVLSIPSIPGNLFVKTGDELRQETSSSRAPQAPGAVNVTVNTGGGGDSRAPKYRGTRFTEHSILKGRHAVVLGHAYHDDEGKLVVCNRQASHPNQPYLVRYGDMHDITEQALASQQSLQRTSKILYGIGASGLVLSGIAGAYMYSQAKSDDK